METLRSHKLRSFLTLLGVVIATATLIVVISIIHGMNLYIASHFANLGANVLVLSQYEWATSEEGWQEQLRRNKPIRIEDYDFLKQALPSYQNIGATAMLFPSPDMSARGHVMYEVALRGVTPSMIEIGQEDIEAGRFISDMDYDHNRAVCFVGQDVASELFPTVDPLGQTLKIGGLPFQVIGVARRLGSTFGQSRDAFAQIPLTTYRKYFSARPLIDISLQAWNARQLLQLQDEVRALMRARHHLAYHATDDFGLRGSESIMALWNQLTGSIFALTIVVVGVFMVIGGIVIMNIMLASVTERIHEIGIRRSLGARRHDILMQVVVESSTMSGVGGVIGVIMAIAISTIVDLFFTSSVPVSAVLAGLALSIAVGLFFGIYPASQAAKLDPIEALRREA
jgi:putative ABC transport system permease protein